MPKDKTFGALLDECSLFPGTVEENLTYGMESDSYTIDDLKHVLSRVMLSNRFNLDDLIDKNTLSRGEQQRLELARIMMKKPNFIILDEPTSALDSEIEETVWNSFLKVCEDATLIYTTHRKAIIKENHLVVDMANLTR